MGVYHPHPEYHHIKKENIGLIEVMGLAVLPARLKKEMAELEHRILNKENLWESDLTKSHAEWAEKWMPNYEITDDNIHAIVQKEIGFVFAKTTSLPCSFKSKAVTAESTPPLIPTATLSLVSNYASKFQPGAISHTSPV